LSTVETSVKVIPLGGLEQIGMNMTVFEYGESIIVVDCGMSFPGDEMLGIDMVIPDITYLKQNIHKRIISVHCRFSLKKSMFRFTEQS